MSEMGSHVPFEYLKYKLWSKERLGSNYQFDSWPLKVKNHPDLFYVQVACHISVKSSQQELQFCFGHHLNQRFEQKVIGLQNPGSPNFGNFEIPNVATLTLNLWPKQRGLQGCRPRGSLGVTPHAFGSVRKCEGMNLHTPRQFSLWEMESRWTP
jgi:hypothetical protein